MNPYSDHLFVRGLSQGSVRVAERAWDEGYAAGLHEENAYPQAWRYGAAEENARIVAALRGKGTHAADVLADQIESEAPAGRAAATPDTRSKIHGTGNVPAPDRWLALDRRSGRVAGLPTVEVVAAEDYDREVNDLRDQVQMYEEKAERDWRDFGEMQDARIAADDRVVELEKELARVCKQLDSANDMVERARSLAHRSRCEGYDEAPAASPDERLREALTDCAATLMTVAPILEAHVYEPNASGYVWNAWTRWGERAARRIDAALTAADREAPDEPTGCCRVCGGSGHVGGGCHGCAPPVSDEPKEKP